MFGESRIILRFGLFRGRRLVLGLLLIRFCRVGVVVGVYDADVGFCNFVCLVVGFLCWGLRVGLGIN